MENYNSNIERDQYKIKLDVFEGPIDLLLHLTKTSEIDIYEIPIAQITNQYLNYLSLLVYFDIDNITEFVEMATTLILIKSKKMLPIDIDFEGDDFDPREELISTLLEYQKYKLAAGLLESKEEESIPLIERDTDPSLFKIDDEEDDNWKHLSIIDLLGAFAEVLNSKQDDDTGLEVALKKYTVDDKIKYLKDLLNEKDSLNYFSIIKKNNTKLELICTFLAILELVKVKMITVKQHIIFGDIILVKR